MVNKVNHLPPLVPSRSVTNLVKSTISIYLEGVRFSGVVVIEQDSTVFGIRNQLLPSISPSRVGSKVGETIGISTENVSFTSSGVIHEDQAIGCNNLLPSCSPSRSLISKVESPTVSDVEESTVSVVLIVHQNSWLACDGNSHYLVPSMSPSAELGLLHEGVVVDFKDVPFSSVFIVEQSSVMSMRIGDWNYKLPGVSPTFVFLSRDIVVVQSGNVTRSFVSIVEDNVLSHWNNFGPLGAPSRMVFLIG